MRHLPPLLASSSSGEPRSLPTASREDLLRLRGARVFFAHQSVGRDIVEGIPAIYARHGLTPPELAILKRHDASSRWLHVRVGANGDPIGKIEDFDALVRGHLDPRPDAALLKLCYSDIRAGSDASEIFAAYRDAMAALSRDHPETAFILATVPLTTRRSPAGRLKAGLGRGDRYGPEHNIVRRDFNALVRAHASTRQCVFDVAAIESTDPDGMRTTGTYRGERYEALARSYAKNPGHLNQLGRTRAADGLLATLANAVRT